MDNVEKIFHIGNFLLLLREILPFGAMYVIYWRASTDMNFIAGLQHVGFGYSPVVLGTAAIIFSKDTFFNKHILSTKFLLLWGDISYPFYLWHFGLAMHDYGANIYQIYYYALIFSIVSLLYVEPFFRKSTNKWTIPFLILAQIAIIAKALKLYYENQ